MEQLTLAPLFQNHMVLQRDKPIHVWGQGPENALITVCFGKNRAVSRTTNNSWNCTLPPHAAARGMELIIMTDIPGFPIQKISDVSVGDVWIAAGQSNMEYFLRYDAHWADIKNAPENQDIHMYNVPRLCFEGQQKDISDSGYWFQEQAAAWETFSAPGYCFARSIQPHLDIPIGIIGCNWGGTPACSWVSEETLQADKRLHIFLEEYRKQFQDKDPVLLRNESLRGFAFEDSPFHQEEWKCMMYGLSREAQLDWMNEHADDPQIPMGPLHMWRPCGLFHHMLKPLAPFSIKGVLWYQGESDSGHADLYEIMFTALIQCWRELWDDDFPFLFVQLAPFGEWLYCGSDGFPEIRRRQEAVSKKVENTYMTSIMDLGMYEDIHPKHKKEVGERLALLARGCVYGEDVLCKPVEFESAYRQGNSIILNFANTGDGLFVKGSQINDLKITGHQNMTSYSWKLDNYKIILNFEVLPDNPVTIQFAETGYAEVNLFNSAGLPAKPFTCVV